MLNRRCLAYLCAILIASPAWGAATLEQVSAKINLLKQARGQALSANFATMNKQYQPERDEPLKNNPRLAAELPERHRGQQQRDQANLDAAKATANTFVLTATEIINDVDGLDGDQPEDVRRADGWVSLVNLVKTQLRPDVGRSPTQYADPEKVQALEAAIERSTLRLNRLVALGREQNEAARRTKEVEDGAGQLVLLYGMADVCAQAGQHFNAKEIDGVKAEVAKQLDALAIAKPKRDEQWAAVQFGIQQSGLRTLPAGQLSAECKNLRGNMVYAFPQVFLGREPLPKNPF